MFYLNVVILITIFANCEAGPSCDSIWPRCGMQENIVCKRGNTCDPDPNSGCVPISNDNNFRNWIVGVHNYYRNRIAMGEENNVVPAANMRVINYDLDLEYTASCAANMCKPHSDYCGRTKKFWQNGQNMEFVNGVEDLIPSIPHRWFERNKFMKSEGYGHYWKNLSLPASYTQMIWAETTHIGCAKAFSSKESKIILVCHYGPPGNINNLPVYISGEPVSECPIGSYSNSDYPGLCGTIKRLNTDKKIHFKARSSAGGRLSHFIFVLVCLFMNI